MKGEHRNTIILKDHDFNKINSCPVCKSIGFIKLGELLKKVNIKRTEISIESINYELRKCKTCNLFYKNYVTKQETEYKLQNCWKDVEGKFHRWEPSHKKGLLKLKKYIDKFSSKAFTDENLNILDVGIGDGNFIKLFYDSYKTYGLEINPIKDVNYNKIVNCEMLYFNIEDTINGKYKSRFHIITALDIFEHFSKPNNAINNFHSMLCADGLLVIETANISSLPAKIMDYNKWWYVSVLEHKIFWNNKTISKFLKKNGFRILKIKKKIHKGGISFKTIPFLKYFTYVISAKLYRYLMSYFRKSQNVPNFPRIPWKDHMLIIAQKVEDN